MQVVQAAIELLDAEGLEGFNMRALGQRLGSAATAVYWHVGSKENLIALAGDQTWNEIALPDPEVLGWREAARQMASELYAMLTRHSWLLQAFGSFLLFGPGKARHDDHGLGIFASAGFTGAQTGQAASIISTFVLGNALGPAAAASLTRKFEREGADAAEVISRNVAQAKQIAAQFPHLRSQLDSPAAEYGASAEDSFEIGLEALLDGLETQLARTR